MSLTLRQETFARECILTGNATQAYLIAYPRSKDWKPKTVNEESCRLKAIPKISARIEELRQELKAKFDIDAERLVLELARIGFSDPRSIFDASGRLIPIHQLSEDAAAAISCIKVRQLKVGDNVEENLVEIKFWNKNVALDSLCKIQGLFKVDAVQKPTSELADLLEEISRGSTRCLPCDDKRRRN